MYGVMRSKEAGDPVTISFWFPWGGGFEKEFYDTVVKPFEEKQPRYSKSE